MRLSALRFCCEAVSLEPSRSVMYWAIWVIWELFSPSFLTLVASSGDSDTWADATAPPHIMASVAKR